MDEILKLLQNSQTTISKLDVICSSNFLNIDRDVYLRVCIILDEVIKIFSSKISLHSILSLKVSEKLNLVKNLKKFKNKIKVLKMKWLKSNNEIDEEFLRTISSFLQALQKKVELIFKLDWILDNFLYFQLNFLISRYFNYVTKIVEKNS